MSSLACRFVKLLAFMLGCWNGFENFSLNAPDASVEPVRAPSPADYYPVSSTVEKHNSEIGILEEGFGVDKSPNTGANVSRWCI
jgi:hypothetical protein